MQTQPKTCIFDLDGTLIDSLGGIQFSAQQAVDAVLPGIVLPSLASYIGPPVREILRKIATDCGHAPPPETLDLLERAFRRSYDGEGVRMSRPFALVPEILARLAEQGVACFVLTNKPLHATQAILAETKLAPLIRAVVSRDSQSPPFASKAAALAAMLEQFAIDAPAAVLIGDSPEDAAAAESRKIRFVGVGWGYGKFPPHAALLRSTAQLLELVNASFNTVSHRQPT